TETIASRRGAGERPRYRGFHTRRATPRQKTPPPQASPPAETRCPPSKVRTSRHDGRLSFPESDNRTPCTRSRRARVLGGYARRIAARSERVRPHPHARASHSSLRSDDNSIPAPWPQCCKANPRECCRPQVRSWHSCGPGNSEMPIAEAPGHRRAVRSCDLDGILHHKQNVSSQNPCVDERR